MRPQQLRQLERNGYCTTKRTEVSREVRVREMVKERLCNHVTAIRHFQVIVLDIFAVGDYAVEIVWKGGDTRKRHPRQGGLAGALDKKEVCKFAQAEMCGNLLLHIKSRKPKTQAETVYYGGGEAENPL